MAGMRVGYVRVSTIDQNESRQLEGIPTDRVFSDKLSGKDTNRPQLQAALAFVRTGDTLLVHSMDRLARDLTDLKKIVEDLTSRGVAVEFVKERLTYTGEDSPMLQLLLNMMGAFSQFERAIIRERQKEGIALAKKRGVYKGRKAKLTADQVAQIKARVASGDNKSSVARDYSISRETLYSYLKP